MKSLFSEKEAQEFIARYRSVPPELALRVYTSRLIGQNPRLVLHGGGNTSLKVRIENILQEEQEVLYVKGSGIDLARIEPEGFVGLDLAPLRRLKALSDLTEEEMENQLQTHQIDSSAPSPSVETLLHVFLPHRYIDHTHADFILALTNQKNRTEMVGEVLGKRVAVVPYVMPGIRLAKAVLAAWEANPGTEAIIVLNHGLFTFGEDARTAYEQMIRFVGKAEAYIQKKMKGRRAGPRRRNVPLDARAARLNQAIRGACSFRTPDERRIRFLAELRDSAEMREISLSADAALSCRSGVLTPDHVTRTKNQWVFLPDIPNHNEELKTNIRDAVERYKADYKEYFTNHSRTRQTTRGMLDPYPRVFLAAGLGMIALGTTRKEAIIAADIAEHTIRAKLMAQAVGAYQPVEESHIFDIEYWKLQQKKVARPTVPPLQGQTALITGAAGAIGLGVADRLLAAGAVVTLADIDAGRLDRVVSALAAKYDSIQIETIIFDVTDYGQTEKALEQISRKTGGIDILVPNAGIAHVARLEELDPKKFDQVIAVNLKGVFNVIKASVPIFKLQGTGGNIVVVSSKNVFDPGASFGAYSASKAGAHQIGKIAALELAEYGVRVNLVSPDAIFGDEEIPSKLWEEVGPERMKARGLDPKGLREYYRQRNLLKVSVTAEHVGNAVVFFASELTPTTGSTLPIDGGIPAAFPR